MGFKFVNYSIFLLSFILVMPMFSASLASSMEEIESYVNDYSFCSF